MNIFFVIVILAVISILWSFWSLKRLEHKKELRHVKESLSKHRVIFRRH